MISNAERDFRAKYPNARVSMRKDRFGTMVSVYAGDYLCAESYSRANAFSNALEWEREGYILPDPDEVSVGRQ